MFHAFYATEHNYKSFAIEVFCNTDSSRQLLKKSVPLHFNSSI